jgi:predicted kinase
MTKLFFLIGLPCSGKSYLAQHLITQHPECQIISTDTIRAKLFGDEAAQGAWLQVWGEVERQFLQAITQKQAAIYDATNAKSRHRRAAIARARELGFSEITGLWLDISLDMCIERNQQRQRQVPEEVILQMHHQLQGAPPSLEDGFDSLIVLGEGDLGRGEAETKTKGEVQRQEQGGDAFFTSALNSQSSSLDPLAVENTVIAIANPM